MLKSQSKGLLERSALVWLAMSGCVLGSEDGGSEYECKVDLRTSGALEGRFRKVTGCGAEMSSVMAGDMEPEVTQAIIVALALDGPLESVAVTMFGPLEASGRQEGVTIELFGRDQEHWQTAEGACTASYNSEPCESDDVPDGLKYTLRDVVCGRPARSARHGEVVVDELHLTSDCRERDSWVLAAGR